MIYTTSVLKGYLSALNNNFLGVPLLIATFFVTIPDQEDLDPYELQHMQVLYALWIITHAFSICLFALYLFRLKSTEWAMLYEILRTCIMFSQMIAYFYSFQTVLLFKKQDEVIPFASRGFHVQQFQTWNLIEVIYVFAVPTSNILYLLCCYFMRQKFYINPAEADVEED